MPSQVFAPTDAAFAKLPAGTVDALLKDTTRLREILCVPAPARARLRACVRPQRGWRGQQQR